MARHRRAARPDRADERVRRGRRGRGAARVSVSTSGCAEAQRRRIELRPHRGAVLLGAALTLTGLAVAYLQAGRPPRDTGNYSHWRTNIDVGLGASSVSSVWRALVPIPSLERSYWNTNIVSARAAVVGVLGLVLFVLVAWILRDRPGSFVVWVGGSRARRRLPLRAHRHRDRVAPHRPHLPLPRRRDVAGANDDTVASSLGSARATPRFPGFPLTRSTDPVREVAGMDGAARGPGDRRPLRRGARSRVPVLERTRRRGVHPAAPARAPRDHRAARHRRVDRRRLSRSADLLPRRGSIGHLHRVEHRPQSVAAARSGHPHPTALRHRAAGARARQPAPRRPEPAPAVARALRQRHRARRALLALHRRRSRATETKRLAERAPRQYTAAAFIRLRA